MSGFIPEITTTVSVNADTSEIEKSINIMLDNEILSQCFDDVIDYLVEKEEETIKLADPTALAVSEALSAYQSAIIKTKHYITGMMENSVDVMQDGEGVYLVGNTAMSVDGFPYPLAIETGSVGHWVAPVTFKALHWEDKLTGEDRFSKGHYVSGIKADPYVDYSIQNLADAVDEIVNPIIDEIWSD